MPTVPAELAQAFSQFPLVVLVFAVAWAVVKWAEKKMVGELTREQERTAAAERQMKEYRDLWRGTEAELRKLIQTETERLRERVKHMEEQLTQRRTQKPRGGP